MIKIFAALFLSIMFSATGVTAIMQHGKPPPRKPINAAFVLLGLALETALIVALAL